MELPQGEGEAGIDVLGGGEGPAAGLVEEGIQAYPAGGDVGGGKGEDIPALGELSAVVSD
jgi:hypothetical protein